MGSLLADAEECGDETPRAAPGLGPLPLSAPVTAKPMESPSPAQKAEATKEVERIMAARDFKQIFGSGAETEQKAEYRRLARLLHPDKGFVTGQRATLALRRVVQAHNALGTAAATTSRS